jgi:hypothetical protein
MFVNANGIDEGLPVNPKATEIYHNNGKAHGQDMTSAPSIDGVAVLLNRNVWF